VKEELRKKVVGVKADEKAKQVAEELLKQFSLEKRSARWLRERVPSRRNGFFHEGGGAVPKIGPNTEFASVLASLTERIPFPKKFSEPRTDILLCDCLPQNLPTTVNSLPPRPILKDVWLSKNKRNFQKLA